MIQNIAGYWTVVSRQPSQTGTVASRSLSTYSFLGYQGSEYTLVTLSKTRYRGCAPWCIGSVHELSSGRSRFESRSLHCLLFPDAKNKHNKRHTSGTPQSYLEEKSKELKILLNGDWQSSLDQSTPILNLTSVRKKIFSDL